MAKDFRDEYCDGVRLIMEAVRNVPDPNILLTYEQVHRHLCLLESTTAMGLINPEDHLKILTYIAGHAARNGMSKEHYITLCAAAADFARNKELLVDRRVVGDTP